MKTFEIGSLVLGFAPHSGQLLSVHDTSMDLDVIQFAEGCELEINGHGVPMELVSQDQDPADPAWQCNLRSVTHPCIGCAQGYDIFRQIIVGGKCKPGGNHINPPNSLHIRYRVGRARVEQYNSPDPQSAGHRPIQMPLWLDTIGVLGGRTAWFGPETRMVQSALGGCGPRSHVSHEEGLVSEVVPHLWNTYRRTHPGVQMVPGAVYYHADGRWLWITAQRPTVGMHWDFELDRLVARFQYHDQLDPAETIYTPEVSLYWGIGGREEMLAVLNDHFIVYEEPNDWFYHTTWFWLHWWQYRPRGFYDMADQVKFMHEELGLTGFGITAHDLRPGQKDCGTSSLRPSPHLGGEAGMRKLGETVRDFGGRMYVWLPFLGMGEPSLDMKLDWQIKGVDGRPYAGFNHGSSDTFTLPGQAAYELND